VGAFFEDVDGLRMGNVFETLIVDLDYLKYKIMLKPRLRLRSRLKSRLRLKPILRPRLKPRLEGYDPLIISCVVIVSPHLLASNHSSLLVY
jgi:hypothetical protein